jgi:transcriptional regulator with XRE-family HTH domain
VNKTVITAHARLGAPAELEGRPAPVGSTLRAVRKAKGLSLKSLAASAGVSVGMISQVERGTANPSIRILERLRVALEVPLSALLERPASNAMLHLVGAGAGEARAAAGPAPATPGFVRRAADRPTFNAAGSTPILKELLSPADAEGLRLMILNVPALATITEVLMAPGIKAGLVLDGKAGLTVGGETAILEEGDSFQFDSALPHSIHNPTRRLARLLWIISTLPAAHI